MQWFWYYEIMIQYIYIYRLVDSFVTMSFVWVREDIQMHSFELHSVGTLMHIGARRWHGLAWSGKLIWIEGLEGICSRFDPEGIIRHKCWESRHSSFSTASQHISITRCAICMLVNTNHPGDQVRSRGICVEAACTKSTGEDVGEMAKNRLPSAATSSMYWN